MNVLEQRKFDIENKGLGQGQRHHLKRHLIANVRIDYSDFFRKFQVRQRSNGNESNTRTEIDTANSSRQNLHRKCYRPIPTLYHVQV